MTKKAAENHFKAHKEGGRGSLEGESYRQPVDWLEVNIAVFAPSGGYYYHWAICIFDMPAQEWHVYEACRTRQNGLLRKGCSLSDPRNMVGYVDPLICLARLDRTHYNKVFAAFEHVRIPRNNPRWNCQDYVWDVASRLVNCDLIGEREVSAAETRLRPYAGRMVEELGARRRALRKDIVLSAEFVEDSDDYE